MSTAPCASLSLVVWCGNGAGCLSVVAYRSPGPFFDLPLVRLEGFDSIVQLAEEERDDVIPRIGGD